MRPGVPTPTPTQRPVGGPGQRHHQPLQLAQGGLAVAATEVARLARADSPVQVDDGAAEAVPVDVDADELASIGGNLQQDGRLAAGRRAGPGLDHEAAQR